MNFLPAELRLGTGTAVEADIAGLGPASIDSAQCPGALRAGRAEVGLRPETMTILPDGVADDGHVARGVVAEQSYYGDMTYYVVKLDGVDQTVTLSMKNRIGRAVLEPGMFFTIEPMVNLGRPETKTLADDWTAVTRDKSLSAQFEHSLAITEDGVEIFTKSPTGRDKPPY